MPLAYLPSPERSVWHLGPVPLRAQGLCVVAGILLAILLAGWRYRKAAGPRAGILDVAAWAVPAGLVPAVIAAVLVHAQAGPLAAVRSWDLAAGFPGAVACGAAGAWACLRQTRQARARLGPVAWAAAPALLFGHAVAMAGQWAAQRGYGRPSSLWWAVAISPAHRALGLENFATFQPVFAYQALSDVALGIAIIWVAHRWALSGGQLLALACAGYAVAGFALSWLGIAHSPAVLGIRATALGEVVLLAAAVAYLARTRRRHAASSQLGGKGPLERSRPVM